MSSGNPKITPPITGIRCMAWARLGLGGLTISKATTANTLATAARPIAATVGSNPRTAILVSGRLRLNTRTPRPPSTSPMRGDRTDDARADQLHFEPRVATELALGEVGESESTSLVEGHDIRP